MLVFKAMSSLHCFIIGFKKEGTLYLAFKDKKAFFTSTDHRVYKRWSCQNLCEAISYMHLLDNIHIRVGN